MESAAIARGSGYGGSAVDVPLVLGYALLAGTMVLGGMVDGSTRLVVAVPLLFFLPGYALLSVLFPGNGGAREDGVKGHRLDVRGGAGVTWGERLALSVATSLSLLAVVGVGLSVVGIPPATAPLLVTLGLVTVLGVVGGGVRRVRLPPGRRLALPLGRWLDELRGAVGGAPTRLDALLNVVLVLAVVAAVAGLAYGLAAPNRGEAYTEAALLTDEGGTFVAGNYTTDVVAGDPLQATLSVENREHREMTYTLVVQVERVRNDGGRAVVIDQQPLLRQRFEVAGAVEKRLATTVRPTMLGRDLRLSYYVYHDDRPATPSAATADEHLYIWVDVRPRTGTLPAENASLALTADAGA